MAEMKDAILFVDRAGQGTLVLKLRGRLIIVFNAGEKQRWTNQASLPSPVLVTPAVTQYAAKVILNIVRDPGRGI